jgi:hypothetical protein
LVGGFGSWLSEPSGLLGILSIGMMNLLQIEKAHTHGGGHMICLTY